MKKIGLGLIILLFNFLFLSNTYASQIDTTSSWNGSSSISVFGELHSATYGQTFLVSGSDTSLESWTFHINDNVDSDYVDFAFYIMDWNSGTTRATGSILYQSAAITTSNNGGSDGMEAFTFNTGGVDLVSGNDYIAFISATGLFDGEEGTSSVGSLRDESAYTDGGFYYQNNENTSGTWDTEGWLSGANWGDLAFTATFSSSVPEPTTILMFGVGLLGLAGVNRRKK